MSELQTLTAQRDEVLAKIHEIEASCEGIENEHNAQRVQELNLEQAQLNAQKQELSAKLSAMNSRLSSISSEIASLSGTGIDRILEAIKNQRWYFFKNKTKVLMDRDTGLLWANLNYYNPGVDANCNSYSGDCDYSSIHLIEMDGFLLWDLPTSNEVKKMYADKTIPFICKEDDRYLTNFVHGLMCVFRISDYSNRRINIRDNFSIESGGNWWFPRTNALVKDSDYELSVSPNNPNYTEKERLQFTLDLFTQNDLWPIFDDEEITELYKKIYYEKPKLM